MKDKEVFDLTQLIISLDVILHKYNKLTIKQKIKIIKQIEQIKKQ